MFANGSMEATLTNSGHILSYFQHRIRFNFHHCLDKKNCMRDWKYHKKSQSKINQAMSFPHLWYSIIPFSCLRNFEIHCGTFQNLVLNSKGGKRNYSTHCNLNASKNMRFKMRKYKFCQELHFHSLITMQRHFYSTLTSKSEVLHNNAITKQSYDSPICQQFPSTREQKEAPGETLKIQMNEYHLKRILFSILSQNTYIPPRDVITQLKCMGITILFKKEQLIEKSQNSISDSNTSTYPELNCYSEENWTESVEKGHNKQKDDMQIVSESDRTTDQMYFIFTSNAQFYSFLKEIRKKIEQSLYKSHKNYIKQYVWNYTMSISQIKSFHNEGDNSFSQCKNSIQRIKFHDITQLRLHMKEICEQLWKDLKLPLQYLRILVTSTIGEIERSVQLPSEIQNEIVIIIEKLMCENINSTESKLYFNQLDLIAIDSTQIARNRKKITIMNISQQVSQLFNIPHHLVYNFTRDTFLKMERKITKQIRKAASHFTKKLIDMKLKEGVLTLEMLDSIHRIPFHEYNTQSIEAKSIFSEICTLIQSQFPSLSQMVVYQIVNNSMQSFQVGLTKHEKSTIQLTTKEYWDKNISIEMPSSITESIVHHILSHEAITKIKKARKKVIFQINYELWKLWDEYAEVDHRILKEAFNQIQLSLDIRNTTLVEVCNELSNVSTLPRFVLYRFAEREMKKLYRKKNASKLKFYREHIKMFLKNDENLRQAMIEGHEGRSENDYFSTFPQKITTTTIKEICDRLQQHISDIPRQQLYTIVNQEYSKLHSQLKSS